MPRMTVYVPDPLWADVKSIRPDLAPSQFFQDALREVVQQNRARPDYARLTPELAKARDDARRSVLDQSTVAYQQGYAIGIRLANDLHWQAFAAFADAHWDWDEWSEFLESEGCDIHLWWNEEQVEAESPEDAAKYGFPSLEDGLSEERRALGLPELVDRPSGPVKEGLVDAIRDAWTGSPAPVVAEGSAPAGEAAPLVEADEEGQ